MNSLQEEIEMMTGEVNNLVWFARKVEDDWINTQLDIKIFHGILKHISGYSLAYYLQKEGVRIIRQCGDKQVGKNTSLTSVYHKEKLLGTLEMYFDIETNKLKVEATC